MIVWEAGRKHEIAPVMVTALKALGVGYPHIRAVHAAYLGTFGFCYRGENGYLITPDGRKALEIWGRGDAFDCETKDREHPVEADRTAVFDS